MSVYCTCEKKEKTSQYKGVYWHKQVGKWYVFIYQKGQKRKYGGMFKYELDAAKRVNQFYQPITNFEIETNSRTQSCLCCNVLIPETVILNSIDLYYIRLIFQTKRR